MNCSKIALFSILSLGAPLLNASTILCEDYYCPHIAGSRCERDDKTASLNDKISQSFSNPVVSRPSLISNGDYTTICVTVNEK